MKKYLYIVLSYLSAIMIAYLSFLFFNQYVNLLIASLLADIICTIIVFIFGFAVNNSSIYDPYWSVIPPFLFILWMINLHSFNLYTYIILAAISLWSVRLTYNFLRNWKGLNHEDWRYVAFRKQFKKIYWLISFLGIHLFPTVVVFIGMYPLYISLTDNIISYPLIFILGILIILLGVMISYFADKHLTLFRNGKNHNESIRIGIWKYSRHPNYLGELTVWFGCFVVSLSYDILHYYTVFGFIAMVLLFNFFSIPVMEKRLIKRKKDYEVVIKEVPRLLPLKINFLKK